MNESKYLFIGISLMNFPFAIGHKNVFGKKINRCLNSIYCRFAKELN